MTKKQRRYGGADKPLEVKSSNVPRSEVIVGRNKGNDANETFVLKLTKANIQSAFPSVSKYRSSTQGW